MPANAGGLTGKARSQVVLWRSASAWFVWVSSGCWVICQPEGSVHATGLVWLLTEVARPRPWCPGKAGTGASATWVDKKARA